MRLNSLRSNDASVPTSKHAEPSRLLLAKGTPNMSTCSRRRVLLVTAFYLAAMPMGSALAAEAPVSSVPAQPIFSRHVVPLFSRLGCNAGACHGTVKGQNGFRLTLFGADPALDHERLLREFGGRRLNLTDPDASLLLLKATGSIPHEGGKKAGVGSSEYQILRAWIAQGAPLDALEKSR